METSPTKKAPADQTEANTQIIPHENESVEQDYNIDAFLVKRKEFITKVNAIMVDTKDYHIIQGKKSLAKGGAEKIASIFGWTVKFNKDNETLEMLGNTPGVLAYVCRITKGKKYIGEGRGASTLQKNSGDPNKTIKMAQKSAFIDGILRASGLSDFFTQDLEDMPPQAFNQPPPTMSNGLNTGTGWEKATPKQEFTIKSLMKQKGINKLSDIGITFEKSVISKDDASKIIKQLIDHKALIEVEPGDIPA